MLNPDTDTHTLDDDFTFAHSAEGIDRAEDVARTAFDDFVADIDASGLDTTIAAIFLAAELLAAVQHHSGGTPEEIIKQFRHIFDARLADYSAGPCLHCMPMPETALH